jgi:hypothetical protein
MISVTNRIPPMTSPLARHWTQPSSEDIVITDRIAIITREEFSGLANYEWSCPSGVYSGKMWRCGEWLCWYGEEIDRQCKIHRRRLLVLEPPVGAQ